MASALDLKDTIRSESGMPEALPNNSVESSTSPETFELWRKLADEIEEYNFYCDEPETKAPTGLIDPGQETRTVQRLARAEIHGREKLEKRAELGTKILQTLAAFVKSGSKIEMVDAEIEKIKDLELREAALGAKHRVLHELNMPEIHARLGLKTQPAAPAAELPQAPVAEFTPEPILPQTGQPDIQIQQSVSELPKEVVAPEMKGTETPGEGLAKVLDSATAPSDVPVDDNVDRASEYAAVAKNTKDMTTGSDLDLPAPE